MKERSQGCSPRAPVARELSLLARARVQDRPETLGVTKPPLMLSVTLACAGLRHVTRELTAAYVNSGACWASVDSSAPDVDAEQGTSKHHNVCQRQKAGSDNRAGFATTRSQSRVGKQH